MGIIANIGALATMTEPVNSGIAVLKGDYFGDRKDELKGRTEEMIKEKEQEINIDKDLKKYFNYKE